MTHEAPPNSNELRIGLVGCGFMGRIHTTAYAMQQTVYGPHSVPVRLVRVADVDRTAAERAVATLGWSEATTDWREVTQAEDVDVVDIVAPNAHHEEIAIDAFASGKHVICEKPLAPSADSVSRMLQSAGQAGKLHFVSFVYRSWPAIALAKELIEEGRLGRILGFRATYLHDYGLDPRLPMSWRFRKDIAGSGALGDIGSHLIDLARFLVGDICRVSARVQTIFPGRPIAQPAGDPVDVDDMALMLLEFHQGARGSLEANWLAPGHKNDLAFEVAGEQGALRFSWMRNGELEYCALDEPETLQGFRSITIGPLHPGAEEFWPVAGLGFGYSDVFIIQAHRFLEAIRNGHQDGPSFVDGLRASEVVDAALEGAQSSTWIDVEHRG